MKFVPKKVSCKILNDNHHQSYYLSVFRTQALSLLPDQPPSPPLETSWWWCWCCHSPSPPCSGHPTPTRCYPLLVGSLLLFLPITKWKSSDRERSSFMNSQWETEALFARSVLFQMFLLYQNEMFLNFLVILSDISTGQGHNEEVIVILPHLQRNSTMMIAWPNSFSTDRLYLFIHLVVHQTSSPSLDVSVSVLLLLPLWKNLFRDVGAGLFIRLLVQVIHLQQDAMCWL